MSVGLNRRDALALVAAAMAPPALAAPCTPPKVLFVCPAGTVKSAIAREELRRRAKAAGVAVQVSSRGVHPEDHVSPALAANLVRDGLAPGPEPARALTPADVAAADIVIAFDEAAQSPDLARARRWSTPSWNSDYPAAKAAMNRQLDGLMAELQGRAPCR